MNAQMIESPSGERMVVISEAEFLAILDRIDDAEDLAAVRAFREKLGRGEEELLPDEMVGRLVAGENAIKVWREHRGLSVTDLARAAAISQAYLSQIEAGVRTGSTKTLRRIAAALRADLDDIA